MTYDEHKEDKVLKPNLNQKSFLLQGLKNTSLIGEYNIEELYKAIGRINMTTYKMCLNAITRKQYNRIKEDLLNI